MKQMKYGHALRLPMQFFAEFGEEESLPQNPEEGFPGEETGYSVKYNGEEYRLSLSELITHAQKGMNYDKVAAERDRLRQGKEAQFLRRLAEKHGMGVEEFILRGGDPEGESPSQEEREALAQQMEAERKNIRDEQLRESLRELAAQYPAMEALPEEVADRIAGGDSPREAYLAYENRELRAEMESLRMLLQNRERASGSMQSTAADTGDSFLEGVAREMK